MPSIARRHLRAGLLTFGLLAGTAAPVLALDPMPAAVEASQQGFDATRLGAIGDFVRRDIAAGKIPGMVLLVLRDGKPVLYEAYGEGAPGTPMRKDSLHRIASTTKIFVTTAAKTMGVHTAKAMRAPIAL